MESLYFCSKCGHIQFKKDDGIQIQCTECTNTLTKSKWSKKDYDSLSEEKKKLLSEKIAERIKKVEASHNTTNEYADADNKNIDVKENSSEHNIDNIKYCTNCGKRIENIFKFCPYCGNKVNNDNRINSFRKTKNIIKDKIIKNKIKWNKKTTIIVAIVSAMVILTIGFFITRDVVLPARSYNSAIQLLENKKYDDAIKIFVELKNYKDSPDRIKECYYKKGKSLLDKDKYEEAKKAFIEADGYNNSDELIYEVDERIAEEEEMLRYLYRKNVLKEVSKECLAKGTSLSSDGLSIMVDSSGEYDDDALRDVIRIIAALELPDSIIDDMDHTSALMGKQVRSYDHYEVSWSYHPDSGLDVLFRLID